MWLSAASALLAIGLMDLPKQSLSADEQRAWTQVRPSVVTLLSAGVPSGLGVCIGRPGYFLAHRSAVSFPTLFGRVASGPQIELKQIAIDEPTQLVLLQSMTPSAGSIPPAKLGSEPEKAGGTLLAVLVSGPLRAEFVSGEKFGVVNPSRRLVPLNELRFETLTPQIGGGLLFTVDGQLMGILGATLGSGEPVNRGAANKGADVSIPLGRTGQPGAGGGGGRLALPSTAPRSVAPGPIGPGSLTIGYSVSSSVLHRVVAGLLSPSRKVLHPAIGVFCKDGIPNGAEVTSIQPDSPSEKAGIKVGDVIFGIGEAVIRNQFDVARVTMRLRIGTTVEVKLRRSGQEMALLVSVGAS